MTTSTCQEKCGRESAVRNLAVILPQRQKVWEIRSRN
jgi:hypothetical protein